VLIARGTEPDPEMVEKGTTDIDEGGRAVPQQ
jgi:hypothetical protein